MKTPIPTHEADRLAALMRVSLRAAPGLSAAGLRVLGTGPRGDDARPSWRWLIALATSRERRDEIVSACRRGGIEALMPVAAFAQPAQLHSVRTAQLVQSAGTVQEARSDSPAVGGRQAANVAQVRQGGDRKRALGVRVSSPLGARRLRVR